MRRLATALIAAAVLFGPPVALAVWIAHTGAPRVDRSRLPALLTDPLQSPGFLRALIAAAAGLLWLVIAAVIAGEAVRRGRRGWRRMRRMPLPTPAQATAGSLAGAALLGMPAATATLAAPGPAPPTPIPQLHTPTPTTPATAPAGIDLPGGGWLPEPTARLAAAAAGALWLRRRRAYLPDPHRAAPRDDPDLGPVPPTVAAVTAAIPDQPAAALITTGRLPGGGIGLDGPGAPAAARGLIVTALLTAAHTHTDGVAVITTRAAATTLLGSAYPAGPLPAGWYIADTLAGALTHLSDTDTAPAALLLATGPASAVLDAFIAEHPNHTVLTVGAWPGHPTWTITADGTLTTPADHPGGRRLCVLDPGSATDLLSLLPPAGDTSHPDRGVPLGSTPDSHDTPRDTPPPATDVRAGDPRARVHLDALGECRVTFDGVPVTLRRSAAVQVLVFLAVHRDGATTREITAAVWPGQRPAATAHRLHTTISYLNTTLPADASGRIIDHGTDRYRLNPAAITCDLWTFQTAVDAAVTAVRPTDRHAAHQTVVARYPGDLAHGQPWPWLPPYREARRRDVIDAYVALAATEHGDTALTLLHQAITIEPHNDDLHRRAQQALTAAGRPDAA